ncbi:MAG: hypothetical protein HON53_10855 [Planctomycetaceae bacterium]|nr:hypothetical protein [Planctomycetaceae bacterium]MBT6155619.1 hypothetical protein [Planctomycetaceae bacterium]MBT6483791.1 hypothetical protein [Planctomycetaceae bacterium]MBT6496365.1 hypothetical protein [Planctomycetaceae bacterium]
MAAAKLKAVVSLVLPAIVVGVIGVAAGVVLNQRDLLHLLPAAMSNANAAEATTDTADDAHGGGGKHVELTAQARHNLGLETGRAMLSDDYYHTLRVPGVIREKPGHSDHSVPTTVHGIIRKVHALPGQTVKPGDPLFDLQLTGEALASAQAGLLDLLKQLETIEAELKRIGPLASSGLAGKRKLELGYERKRLDGQRAVRAQELLVRGLLPAQVKQIIREKKLIRQFTVFVPQEFADEPLSGGTARQSKPDVPVDSPGDALAHEDMQFTLETLDVFPGKSVRPGDSLCHLAYHTVLYVEGQAFENEIEVIDRLRKSRQPATLEFGTLGYESKPKEAQILYLDNHVDPDSQTFRFYMRLENEALREPRHEQSKLYRTWKYKPGQRVHIVIPAKKWEDVVELKLGDQKGRWKLPLTAIGQEGSTAFVYLRTAHKRSPQGNFFFDEFKQVPVDILHRDAGNAVIEIDGEVDKGDFVKLFANPEDQKRPLTLPLKAVVQEGPDAFIFRRIARMRATDGKSFVDEFEQVPVRILYQDTQIVVIARDEEVHLGDIIAFNNAYQLQLALTSGKGGGGGHHGHSH